MGNTGSQTGQVNNRHSLEDQWTQSFPRTQPTRFQHKVLPERDTRQRLRHTDNGEILQQGGTLSGRHQSQLRNSVGNLSRIEDDFCESPSSRPYLPAQRYPFHKTGFGSSHYIHHKQNAANQKALKEQMKLFGSEPDLRFSTQLVSPEQEMKERRNRKKYKAPPPPSNKTAENQLTDWDENSSDDFPIRRARLFKTRAEMRKQASHVKRFENNLDLQYEEKTTTVQINSHQNSNNLNINKSNRLSLPEMRIAESEEFQRELKEATSRLRNTKDNLNFTLENSLEDREKLKTLDPNRDLIKRKFKQIIEIEENNNTTSTSINSPRGEPSGKESSTPEQSPSMLLKNQSNSKPKTFYFGMEEKNHELAYRSENVIAFGKGKHITHSSESDISTDIDPDETNDATSTGIDLQLRPILPKKQLEIPRFSPAIAWKLLSAIESENCKESSSDDIPVMIEDKIEKYSRPPPPNFQIGQKSHDKSGDSGISGDAGPVGFEESEQINTKKIQYERKTGMSWVPQQDLEDDSSVEELNQNLSAQRTKRNLLNRPHVFSLSLPRDNQLSSYMADKANYNSSSFQKLKRSVSGVFGNLSHRRDLTQSSANQEDGSNWFFSKSAPNSLNNGFNSLDTRNTHEETDMNFTTSKTYHRSSTNRLMYLPEYTRELKIPESEDDRKYNLSVYSKSCENLNIENASPETLQDAPGSYDTDWRLSAKKPKKFTFQSTVRQIERKRMAEKLSKEAEKKERQRLRELEAMQRVEEEFQKKRAKEKASIRQQLRLYAMDDTQWTSLPPNFESKTEERQEPDGAFSSSTTSSSPSPPQLKIQKSEKSELKYIAPVTQELSEYRQVQRDYKDYRGNFKYSSDSRYPKQTTVHPEVTCNMPKAKGSNSGHGNYRKDFAYGVKSTKSLGSAHSEESISNSPKMYHNKHTPITRF